MATLPQCPRCETFYAGTDFCMKCRIADLEVALDQLATVVRDQDNRASDSEAGWMTEDLRKAMAHAKIVLGGEW